MANQCWTCGADLPEDDPERTTCYTPEDCVSRLLSMRDAWKLLAHAYRRRDKKMRADALARLARYGEINSRVRTRPAAA